MKIIWLSQHQPTKRQVVSLTAIFPDHELVVDARSFDSAADIAKRFHDAKADEIVVVAPLLVVRELVRLGIHPLYAEMHQVSCRSPDAEVRTKGSRCYKFVRFHRVNDVRLDLGDILTTTTTTTKETTKS